MSIDEKGPTNYTQIKVLPLLSNINKSLPNCMLGGKRLGQAAMLFHNLVILITGHLYLSLDIYHFSLTSPVT